MNKFWIWKMDIWIYRVIDVFICIGKGIGIVNKYIK